MNDWLLELGTRLLAQGVLGIVVVLVLALLALEALLPLFAARAPLLPRWRGNWTLGLLNFLLGWGLALAGGLLGAATAAGLGIGLFHWWQQAPAWLVLLATFLALDLVRYATHVLMHHWRPLWRLHLVHHTDPDVDLTTGLRGHPFEVLFNLATAFIVVALLGCPPELYVLQQLVALAWNYLQHVNIAVPARLDRLLRWVVVTPDMHRLHHSSDRRETNTNYGTVLSAWDRLFGTFIERPRGYQAQMTMGLGYFRGDAEQTPLHLLTQPFRYRPPMRAVEPAPREAARP